MQAGGNGPQVNVPQHTLNAQVCQPLANTQNPNAPNNMAAALNAQNCQSLIAAPRLNGNQLSFPSPAAAAAAAMGLQMHHAAAAAAMSAAAAASGQQNLNNQQHQSHMQGDVAGVTNGLNGLNNSNSNLNMNLTNVASSQNTNNNNSLSTINIPPPHIRPSP
ncbi:uncharacterized protein LOC142219688, partial [Haematobia irritans]|uniref:uncharacterized protein LOC142219688 n=1 Tax=Haematobia irritans TaxID=7368 RepID=UPI003F502D90